MKKSLTITGVLFSLYVFSQCTIDGKSTINVGEEAIYSVPNDLAQCSDCHQWKVLGNNIAASPDNRQNNLVVKPSSIGNSTLSLTVLTSSGIQQCSKNIEVLSSENSSYADVQNEPQKTDCDIKVTSFKEIKYDEGIVNFIPNVLNAEYQYKWEVLLADGSKINSEEIVPQFNYSLENGISKVNLKLISKKCIRELGKKYDKNYWMFFR